MSNPLYVQVALEVPIGDYFDYLLPSKWSTPALGARVKVPFGSRTLVGVVIGISSQTAVAQDKLKQLIAVLDTSPLLPKPYLELARFLSRYYHYPLGETIATMMPTLVKKGHRLDEAVASWQISGQSPTKPLTQKQQQTLSTIDALARLSEGVVPHALLQQIGISVQQLNALVAKNCLKAMTQDHRTAPISLKQQPPPLNDEQKAAVLCINENKAGYRGFLLDGVTGSGKTEVYLQAITKTLQEGKQALVLVPEIGLTPQTYARFARRFCANILVLHSNLSDKERLAGFASCQKGSADLVVATRSALLYPFANLGLIIVDEAHDPSYKQQDHLRYHACDVALYLGRLLGCTVVLGTATPSLEQLTLASSGKLCHLKLTYAIGSGQHTLQLIDKRLGSHQRTNKEGELISSHLSPMVITAIDRHLARGEQVLVFLNQRGYAPILLCHACGHQFDCPCCDKHLTLHNTKKPKLHCHHCQYRTPKPLHCPTCRSSNLITLGQGTSQLFEHLHALFADPQTCTTPYPVLQIDRDTTHKKHDWQAIYTQVLSNRPMILVGTQMLAKGHHFPGVTLVVIVNADSGLASADFRASEQLCQQIIQVAGRAGRGDRAGSVLIQTLMPNHPLLTLLTKHGYHAAADHLLKERQLLGLPPARFAALIESEHSNQKQALDTLIPIAKALGVFEVNVSQPSYAPFAKRKGRYFAQLFVTATNRHTLHHALNTVWSDIKNPRTLSLTIDPIGF